MPLGTPIKLTDIVLVMKNKWIYGDKFFGYTEEFNDNHNTQYPSMLITPPTSVFPEVGINNGWEEYTFEIYFSDLYNRTQQANEQIDQRWENLQDLATEWLDDFLKHYQNTAPILAFLEDESVSIERNKEVANDQLLQLKLTFTWRVMSMCFRPQSTSPNQIPNLLVWLRAASGVTYSTPTKKVSAWEDGSGNGNVFSSPTSNDQPERYSYGGGARDKTRIEFDGSQNYLSSAPSASPLGTDFTIFTVAKATPHTVKAGAFETTLSTTYAVGSQVVTAGNPLNPSTGTQLYSFTDGATDRKMSVSFWANLNPTEPWRGFVEKNETGQAEWQVRPEWASGYINFKLFDNQNGGYIGCRVTSNASIPLGEWHHIVCTYDGSATAAGCKIYIDTVESQNTTMAWGAYNSMVFTTSPLDIGNGNTNSYYGDLDEVSVYNKALSLAEIEAIYNNRTPISLVALPTASSLLGWWRMGEGATYPTIPDASQYGNDATMTLMTAENIRAFAPTPEKATYLSYEQGNSKICFGSSSSRLYCHLADSSQGYGEWHARNIWNGDTSAYHIGTMSLNTSFFIASGTTDGAVAGIITDSTAAFNTLGIKAKFVITDTATGLSAFAKAPVTASTIALVDINGGEATLETSGVNYEITASVLKLQYNDGTPQEDTLSEYDSTESYNIGALTIGHGTHLSYLDGSMSEIIIYNRALDSFDTAKVQDYLNKKYKIY